MNTAVKVICFGDSNTYGYDPRSFWGDTYGKDCCWVQILAEKTGWDVFNQGENGRQVPSGKVKFPDHSDFILIMLGTNDLLQGHQPEAVSARMERFLMESIQEKEKLILIAPPPMRPGEWVSDQKLIAKSLRLTKCYEQLAEKMEIHFLNSGLWRIPLAYDGVHFTEEGHKKFADELIRYMTAQVKSGRGEKSKLLPAHPKG